jgi:hypothetical protein
MLLGRDRELARLGRMLDAAQHGPSSAVIMHGDPGVGKTALLDAAAGIARGFTVLRARPLQAESELPFAGLADLLRPLLGLLDRIPPPQAAALSGALAIGPATPGDRFAAAAATISLLAAGGEASPVLAVIDDAQWLDTPSREALLFTARRLGSERVVLLFAMRDRPWRSTSRIDGLELPGLGTDAAAALVTRSGKIVSPAVRDRLVGETAGNPAGDHRSARQPARRSTHRVHPDRRTDRRRRTKARTNRRRGAGTPRLHRRRQRTGHRPPAQPRERRPGPPDDRRGQRVPAGRSSPRRQRPPPRTARRGQ